MISTAVAAKAKERPATAPEFEEELGGIPLGEEPSEYVPIDEQSATGASAQGGRAGREELLWLTLKRSCRSVQKCLVQALESPKVS